MSAIDVVRISLHGTETVESAQVAATSSAFIASMSRRRTARAGSRALVASATACHQRSGPSRVASRSGTADAFAASRHARTSPSDDHWALRVSSTMDATACGISYRDQGWSGWMRSGHEGFPSAGSRMPVALLLRARADSCPRSWL